MTEALFTPADSLSLALFSIFSFIMAALIGRTLFRANKTSGYFFCLFLFVFSSVVLTGIPKSHPLPTIPIIFLGILTLSFILAFSSTGKKIIESIPLAVLIGFQVFRIPLELILHHWANLRTIPETMTWSGQNFDIFSGIVAILFVPLVKRQRTLAWIPTLVGLILLINVLRVVVLSSPFPFGWGLERPLLLIMFFPYALIGPLFVAPALVGHLLSVRALLRRS